MINITELVVIYATRNYEILKRLSVITSYSVSKCFVFKILLTKVYFFEHLQSRVCVIVQHCCEAAINSFRVMNSNAN